jgi:hypothetical protein
MTETTNRRTLRERIYNALALVAIGAAVAVAVGFPVAGALTGGTLRANFALALIVIAVLLDIAVLLSYVASSRIQTVVHVAWLSVAIMCLIFTEYILTLNEIDADKTADTVLLIVMLALTFPAGWVAIGATFVYSVFFLSNRGTNPLELILFWLFFFTAGYLQWFKILPWLIHKWRIYRTSQGKTEMKPND